MSSNIHYNQDNTNYSGYTQQYDSHHHRTWLVDVNLTATTYIESNIDIGSCVHLEMVII